MTIKELALGELGTALTLSPEMQDEVIKRWRLFFQEAADVLDSDLADETKWPALYNHLIAKLLIREQLVADLKKSASTSASTGKGGLKSIEAGPSKAEWYEAKEASSSSSSSGGGSLEQMEQEICELANKLGVRMSICRKFKQTMIFKVAKKPCNE